MRNFEVSDMTLVEGTKGVVVALYVFGNKVGNFFGDLKDGLGIKGDVWRRSIKLYLKNGNEIWIHYKIAPSFTKFFQDDKKITEEIYLGEGRRPKDLRVSLKVWYVPSTMPLPFADYLYRCLAKADILLYMSQCCCWKFA